MEHIGKRLVLTLMLLVLAAEMSRADDAGLGTVVHARFAQIEKTYGVAIHYNYSPSVFFRENYLRAPISAKGSAASAEKVNRLASVIARFLSRYPKSVLKRALSGVYVVGSLEFYGRSYPAWTDDSRMYLNSESLMRGRTDLEAEGFMHHDFARALLRHYDYLFPGEAWHEANVAGWEYANVVGGAKALREQAYSKSEELLRRGFLFQRCQVSIEDDFSMYAYWLFTQPGTIELLASKYKRIDEKCRLAKRFYDALDEPEASPENLKKLLELTYGVEIVLDSPQTSHTEIAKLDWTPIRPDLLGAALVRLYTDLRHYEPAFVKKHLKRIAICSGLSFDGLEYGGTYDRAHKLLLLSARTLGDDGMLGRPRGFHHEFMGILLDSYEDKFSREQWEATCPADFKYTFEESSGRTLMAGANAKLGDPNCYSKGFLCSYGRLTLDEDIATYAQCFVARNKTLASLATEYPLIGQKTKLLEEFYRAIGY